MGRRPGVRRSRRKARGHRQGARRKAQGARRSSPPHGQTHRDTRRGMRHGACRHATHPPSSPRMRALGPQGRPCASSTSFHPHRPNPDRRTTSPRQRQKHTAGRERGGVLACASAPAATPGGREERGGRWLARGQSNLGKGVVDELEQGGALDSHVTDQLGRRQPVPAPQRRNATTPQRRNAMHRHASSAAACHSRSRHGQVEQDGRAAAPPRRPDDRRPHTRSSSNGAGATRESGEERPVLENDEEVAGRRIHELQRKRLVPVRRVGVFGDAGALDLLLPPHFAEPVTLSKPRQNSRSSKT